MTASDTIKSKNTSSSTLDAQLFLVRHLLILKEMTQNLDFSQKDVQPSIDLGGVTGEDHVVIPVISSLPTLTPETLASILNRTTSLLPNALFASLGMPRGDENLGDAKHVSSSTGIYYIPSSNVIS